MWLKVEQQYKIVVYYEGESVGEYFADLIVDGNVIVELKASNIDLEAKHLSQLEYYLQRAEEWLQEQNLHGFQVHGHLIGTKASPKSRAEGAVILRRRIKESGPETPWRVRDYLDVLRDTQAAHEELLEIHRRAEQAAAADDDEAE